MLNQQLTYLQQAFSGQKEVVCKTLWKMINYSVTQVSVQFLVPPLQKTTGKPNSIYSFCTDTMNMSELTNVTRLEKRVVTVIPS